MASIGDEGTAGDPTVGMAENPLTSTVRDGNAANRRARALGQPAVMAEMLEWLRGGAGGLLIEGDPGIGKTTICVRRSSPPMRTATGCSMAPASKPKRAGSFVGLNDLIADGADDVIPSLADRHREVLEGALVRDGARRTVDARAIGVALRAFLVARVLLEPVLIGIDDLQWLDGAPAAARVRGLRRLEGHRVGVLATVRAPTAIG